MSDYGKMTYHEMQSEIRKAKADLLDAEAKVLRLQAQIKQLSELIKKRKEKGQTVDVFITDHCLLRYLERVEGIDMNSYRKQLTNDLRKVMKGMPKDLDTSGVKMNGLTFKINGNAVTTVF